MTERRHHEVTGFAAGVSMGIVAISDLFVRCLCERNNAVVLWRLVGRSGDARSVASGFSGALGGLAVVGMCGGVEPMGPFQGPGALAARTGSRAAKRRLLPAMKCGAFSTRESAVRSSPWIGRC